MPRTSLRSVNDERRPSVGLLPPSKKEGAALVDHPQMWGILPTWWFWTSRNIRLSAWLAIPLALLGTAYILSAGYGPIMMVSRFLLLPGIVLGVTERILRIVIRRRELAASREADAIAGESE